jgi:hypothetical protein
MANRRFVAGNFIRRPDQLDYLQEPDVFHDVFGHVPMLADPVFADYLEAYGRGGVRAMQHDALKYLGRLYWYTVEFGLIAEPDGLRIYGSGIASSYAESQFALDDPSPHRLAFDMKRVMQTEYRIDDFQQNYFVIPSFEELLRQTVETDFAPLYEELKAQPDIPVARIEPGDRVITEGTQDYARQKGLRAASILSVRLQVQRPAVAPAWVRRRGRHEAGRAGGKPQDRPVAAPVGLDQRAAAGRIGGDHRPGLCLQQPREHDRGSGAAIAASSGAIDISGPASTLATTRSNGAAVAISWWSAPSATTSETLSSPSRTPFTSAFARVPRSQRDRCRSPPPLQTTTGNWPRKPGCRSPCRCR